MSPVDGDDDLAASRAGFDRCVRERSLASSKNLLHGHAEASLDGQSGRD